MYDTTSNYILNQLNIISEFQQKLFGKEEELISPEEIHDMVINNYCDDNLGLLIALISCHRTQLITLKYLYNKHDCNFGVTIFFEHPNSSSEFRSYILKNRRNNLEISFRAKLTKELLLGHFGELQLDLVRKNLRDNEYENREELEYILDSCADLV